MTDSAAQLAPLPDFPDLESHVRPDDHQALRLWLRLLSCTNLIENEVRSRLRAQFNTTLPRFDMMAQLDRVPEGLTGWHGVKSPLFKVQGHVLRVSARG